MKQNILVQIKTNYYRALEKKENVSVVSKKLGYLEKNLEAVSAKYDAGLATLTEMIDAQTKKSGAELENQQALYGYYLALNEFEYSMGGGK